MLEDKIRWSVFKRLLVHNTELKPSLDFIREALTNGLELRRVLEPWEPDNPVFMRIWRKAFWSEDRRLVTLSAGRHELTFRFPEEEQRWFGELLRRTERIDRDDFMRRSSMHLAQLKAVGGAV